MTQQAVLPGSTLGVLGGGQLGRMFALEAIRMGYTVWVLDADPMSPAGCIAHRHLQAPFDDQTALDEMARACDVVTTEFENIPAETLRYLAANTRVAPQASALEVAQDRRREKRAFAQAGVPTVVWAEIATDTDVANAWREVAGAGILKTATLGYDGKGQVRCDSEQALADAVEHLGGVPCVFERMVPLAAEVSVVVARNAAGDAVCLPVGENVHRNGILHTTRVPARVTASIEEAARATALRIAVALDYCGVMAVEFFVTDSGELLANEIAPRPHNSGHYSQLGCAVNQFECQVRAISGLPLLPVTLRQPTAMLNLLGDVWADGEPDWCALQAIEGCELHLYGKQAARAGRKMGHLNLSAATDAALDLALEQACSVLGLHHD